MTLDTAASQVSSRRVPAGAMRIYAAWLTVFLLLPLERWTGGSIPIFFHLVLAGFILTVAFFHRRYDA